MLNSQKQFGNLVMLQESCTTDHYCELLRNKNCGIIIVELKMRNLNCGNEIAKLKLRKQLLKTIAESKLRS